MATSTVKKSVATSTSQWSFKNCASTGDPPASGCSGCGRAEPEHGTRGNGVPLAWMRSEGELGLRFITAPSLEVKRCGLGQGMGERVSNLPDANGPILR
jgi:hypothetical protein